MKHLEFAKQTYFQHFFDSISYSFIAFKASFYFFIHALVPDIYQCDGSKTIFLLNNKLRLKKK